MQACFGVYLFMGFVLMTMGGLYWSDAGAVGATAVYLLLIGFLMLVVGGIALFANFKKIWIILFIIELFNVALFLFLYVVIVIVLMMASGSSDPVTKSTKASWDTLLPELTFTGSDGAGGIYCKTATGGTACDSFFSTSLGPASTRAGDTCDIAETDLGDILANCSSIQLNPCNDDSSCPPGFADSPLATKCSAYYGMCDSCQLACMQASIDKVKDQMLPASYFTFFLCFYLFIVVCFNQIALGADEMEGVLKIAGLVLNGLVVLFSFVAFVIAIIGMVDANDACPEGKDCVPTSMLVLIFLGFCLLVLGGLATGGIYINNNMLIRIATLVMIFASIALLLAALLMGISSGAVLDDMGYYYDTNYPKLRSALEKGDNSYCQLNEADCKLLTYDTAGTAGVYPKNEDGNIVIDSESPYWDGVAYQMTAAEVWKDQYAILAAMAKKDDAAAWLEPCETTGICIYCDEFAAAVHLGNPGYTQNAPPAQTGCYEARVRAGIQGEGRTQADAERLYSFAADATACAGATEATCETIDSTRPDLAAGVTEKACVWLSSLGNCFETATESVAADVLLCNAIKSDTQLANDNACKAVRTTATSTAAAPTCLARTPAATATDATCTALIANTLGEPSNRAECEANSECVFTAGYVNACTYQSRDMYKQAPNLNFLEALSGNQQDLLTATAANPASTPPQNLVLKKYVSAFPYDDTNGYATENACTGTDAACTAVAMTQDDVVDAAACAAVDDGCVFKQAPMTVAEWTSMISNFTTFNHDAKFSMPKCESALQDYVKSETACPETPEAGDANIYKADCAACNSAFTPFLFNADTGMSGGSQQQCLNFFVGHLENECGGGSTQCIDEVRPNVAGRCEGANSPDQQPCENGGGTWAAVPDEATRKSHIDPIITDALAGKNGWGGYTDKGCKIKIQDTIENSMSTIGIAGAIFLLFFIGIIFFTEQGIVIYKGGGGDDDDDDDDDDDSDE